MTKRDSWLVKRIKKMERLGDRANANLSEYYFYSSPEGQMAEAVDHISEVAYEALNRYDEMKAEEKREEELEEIRCNAKRSKKTEFPVENQPSVVTPSATPMVALFRRVISMVRGT